MRFYRRLGLTGATATFIWRSRKTKKKIHLGIIVEMTKEYCSERKELQSQMAAKGFILDEKLREFEQPLPVDVVGLAFQDNAEPRGSSKVNSLWEIHPAIVKIVSPRELQKIK